MRGETGSISKSCIHGELKSCDFHRVWEWIFRDDHHIDVYFNCQMIIILTCIFFARPAALHEVQFVCSDH